MAEPRSRPGEGIWAVSACLAGRACRYDGRSGDGDALRARLAALEAAGARLVAVCPEELGGLGTPRPAAGLSGGDGHDVLAGRARVLRNHDGLDVTAAYVAGAAAALAQAEAACAGVDDEIGAPRRALLKARSPSCGAATTWIDGAVRPGDGVFAARLRAAGWQVASDEDPR